VLQVEEYVVGEIGPFRGGLSIEDAQIRSGGGVRLEVSGGVGGGGGRGSFRSEGGGSDLGFLERKMRPLSFFLFFTVWRRIVTEWLRW